MQTAAIEAATDAISFVTLHAQAKRQVASGDGIAKGIGALRPVGQTADFVTEPGIHRRSITFAFIAGAELEERMKGAEKDNAQTQNTQRNAEEYPERFLASLGMTELR